jgi:hypothetical protein
MEKLNLARQVQENDARPGIGQKLLNPYIVTNGKKWFYRLKGENGLLENISDEDKVLHLIVSYINSEQTRFYTSFEAHSDFLLYMLKLPLEKRCFHEVVIDKRQQKMRFDLDIKRFKYIEDEVIEEVKEDEVEKFLDMLIESTIEEFEELGFKLNPKDHILVFSSHGKEKWSYHIIIDGFYCETHQDANELFKKITGRMNKDHLDWLDSSIYSANHCLRTLGSVKDGKLKNGDVEIRVKTLEKKWKFRGEEITFEYPEVPRHENHRLALEFERSFLTLITNCYPLPTLFHKQVMNEMEKQTKEKQANDEVMDYAFRVFQSYYGNICSYMGCMANIIMLKRNYASGCPICDRVHENENAFLYLKPVESENDVLLKYEIYFDCRRSNGKKIKIGEKKILDEKHLPKDKIVVEKSSKRGFCLSDIEYVSRNSVHNFK